jgi:hypothetical protein
MHFNQLHRREFITLIGVAAASLFPFAAYAAEGTPAAEVPAAQIRKQGYRCDGSLTAEREFGIASVAAREGERGEEPRDALVDVAWSALASPASQPSSS